MAILNGGPADYARGVVDSAYFLMVEFEGNEAALDFAKCLIGEIVREWGMKDFRLIIESEKLEFFKEILEEIENQTRPGGDPE